MSQHPELCSCEEILEFWYGRWHSTHDLVATDAGKYDAISLRGQAHLELRRSAAVVARSQHETVVGRCWRWSGVVLFLRILLTEVDVPAYATTLLFHFCEVGALV